MKLLCPGIRHLSLLSYRIPVERAFVGNWSDMVNCFSYDRHLNVWLKNIRKSTYKALDIRRIFMLHIKQYKSDLPFDEENH